MKFNRRAAIALGALLASPCILSGTAHADLLGLERWATNQGSWLSPSTFLSGDFDGNGKTDLAYVFIACSDCANPFDPYESEIIVGVDVHLACDNASVACPAGVPNANASGAFVLDHASFGSAGIANGCTLDSCGGFTGACGIGISGSPCNVITGSKLRWLSGDFDGDGKTDLAFVYSTNGQIYIQVGISQGVTNNFASFAWSQWNTNQGTWADTSSWVVGDFDGDGKDDLGYAFEVNGQIDIDVHKSLGSAAAGGFQLERWATNQGAWPSNLVFTASDLNGDGLSDIALAFEVNGLIDLDAHLSTGSAFQLQRWATNQGAWINGGAGVAQWTSVPGSFGRRDLEHGESLITPVLTPAPGNGLGGAGLGDLIYAFNDNGLIDIDGHLATLNDAPTGGMTFGTTAGFNLQRYATNQGTYPQNVQFFGGDFNGDTVGDVADAFEVAGQIDIDVHKGECLGPLAQSGQCCAPFSSVCDGLCCFGTCNANGANDCCPFGQTCPAPPPPR